MADTFVPLVVRVPGGGWLEEAFELEAAVAVHHGPAVEAVQFLS